MKNYYAERRADKTNQLSEAQTNDLHAFLNETQSQRQARMSGAKVEAYGGEVEEGKPFSPAPAVLPTEPPPAPVGEWFYLYQGETQGPVTERTIRELGYDCLVWRKGLPDWRPMSALPPAIVPSYAAPLPLINSVSPMISGYNAASLEPGNSTEVSNEIVWFWAFVPLLVGLLPMVPSYVWWLVHTVLWFIDGQFIKSAGRDRQGWGFWGWLFPPVYLFLRASRLKQNNAYAWVFLVCCVVSAVLLFSTALALVAAARRNGY
jgi:GYF domain 2